jgi:xanthine dehydrogenase accessory factor
MREIWPDVVSWQKLSKSIAMATVVKVEGSSLRPLGSKMIVSTAGDIAGSVTGGCVEGAVYEESQEVLATGKPRLLEYGVPDETAWSVGLTCGGSIQVFVESLATEPWAGLYRMIDECIAKQQLAAVVSVVSGPGLGNKLLCWPDGRMAADLGSPTLNQGAAEAVSAVWATQECSRQTLASAGKASVIFIDVLAPLPRLIIIGAVHIAIPLVTIARALNFHTIVIDARSAFATRERFPLADDLIVEWPSTALEKLRLDETTYVVCLSHDDKLDNPALKEALSHNTRYIGALGALGTHEKRKIALREMGVPAEDIARIHAPVGLNLGAKQPEEIALSIMAEVMAARHGVSFSTDTRQR